MRWLLMAIAFLLAFQSFGQDKTNWERQYLEKPPAEESFDRQKWEELSKELDYSPTEKQVEQRQEPASEKEENESSSSSPVIPGMEYVMYVLAAIIILLLLYFLVFKNLGKTGKRVRRKDITLEDIEEDLERTDVLPLLDQAIRDGNYKLATRLYYLKCLKSLSMNGFIQWEKDKTNGEYLRELQNQELKRPFRGLTLQFERVWYGEQEIDKPHFDKLQMKFEEFLQLIDHHKTKAA